MLENIRFSDEIACLEGDCGVGGPLSDYLGVAPRWAITALTTPAEPSAEVTGRLFDILFAIAALLFALPLMLVIAALLKIDRTGGALFAHRRIGRYGETFACLKFRTMVPNADAVLAHLLATSPAARAEWERDFKLREDPRITRFGYFLRRTSLDELPQLFNVLFGDMSVVGPRPIVRGEIVRYGVNFADYCLVRPGLTGLWQIGGRNHLSYDERVRLDTRYARSKTLRFDLMILLKTIPAVLLARGSC